MQVVRIFTDNPISPSLSPRQCPDRYAFRAGREEIREDQIIGGMLSFYNPSITQRLNGLVEKQETSITIEQPLFGDGV